MACSHCNGQGHYKPTCPARFRDLDVNDERVDLVTDRWSSEDPAGMNRLLNEELTMPAWAEQSPVHLSAFLQWCTAIVAYPHRLNRAMANPGCVDGGGDEALRFLTENINIGDSTSTKRDEVERRNEYAQRYWGA